MRFRHATYAAIGCLAMLLSAALLTRPESRPQNLLRDFNAFYCAGQMIRRHEDPYRNEPLGSCERTAERPAFLARAPAALTIPAPLPGYALAPFALPAFFPYGIAAAIWSCILLGSFLLTIRLLHALLRLPLPVIIAALALSDAYVGLTLGQIAPIAVAAIVAAAHALTRKKHVVAACAASVAMIEPHMGLPACIALAVFSPRTIIPLFAAACGAAMLCFTLLGAQANAEYFTDVIGAHAFAEIGNVKQLGFPTLLADCGIAAPSALRIGVWCWLGMFTAGLFLARSIAARTRRSATLILIPVACAMIGCPFIHIAQLAIVVPAALFLLDALDTLNAPENADESRHFQDTPRLPTSKFRVNTTNLRKSALAIASILLLAVPWPQFASLGTSFPLLAAATVGILCFFLLPNKPVWLVAAPLSALLLAMLPTELLTDIPDPTAHLLATYDPHALAQSSWGAYVALVGTQNHLAYAPARLPTACGLLAFLLCLFSWPYGPRSVEGLREKAGAAGGD